MPDIFVAEPENKKEAAPKKHEALTSFPLKSVKNSPIIEDSLDTGNKVHLFSSFCQNPKGISFKTQEKDEIILLFLRKHLITNLKWLLTGIFFLLIPLLSIPFINLNQPILFLPVKFNIFFLLFYYLLIFSYFYVSFITWFFNIGLITNKRIIDIDLIYLIYKHMTATKLSLIQEVSSVKSGVMSTFFDYGDVFIQTAGSEINVDFKATPQPENSVHIIQNLIGKHG